MTTPEQLQSARDAANRADFNEMVAHIHVNVPHRRRSWQRTVDIWGWVTVVFILIVLLLAALSGMM